MSDYLKMSREELAEEFKSVRLSRCAMSTSISEGCTCRSICQGENPDLIIWT